jgi:hypoxanthine phosphoribosyltransferase
MNNFYYSWQNFTDDVKILSGKIMQDTSVPEAIFAIKRGGSFLGTSLSYIISKPVWHIDYKEKINLNDLNFRNILIVDDICDSGNTFANITKGVKNFKTCSLFFNVKQNFCVDYFSRKIDRDKEKFWIVFPWEMNT